MARVYAGTSGFAYPSWKPDFYPQNLPAKRFLEHYSRRLNSSEINYTFHRLPSPKSLAEWVQVTPDGFVFSLKAHMKLTHVLRLKDCESFSELFFKVIDPLRVVGRLGPVLFQLPPNLKGDVELLEAFLKILPPDIRYAFEFRSPTWLEAPVYSVLEKYGVCLCLAESERLSVPEVLTAPFVYFRLRMPDYSATDRAEIAEKVQALRDEGRDVYVYFKHEESPAGPLYAEELLTRLR